MNTTTKVAFNTIIQYIQLLLNVLLGLFTVRIILNTLGTVDYGIYNLIGGIVVLLSFISTSLSQTSVRFISVSLGSNDNTNVREAFSSCFSLHLFMAAGLAIILEITGLFLFDGLLNIPNERIVASHMVYHCMVFTLFLNIFNSPFAALVIAHEDFIINSIIGITDYVFKLLIALAVASYSYDKLIYYAALMAGVIIFNVLCYIVICFIRYRKCISIELRGPTSLKTVSGFAGWTLLDVLGSVLNRQGYAIMLNKFFGPTTNTVYALAGQIEGHLYSISSSAINTMKPQIMKSFGAGDINRTFRLSMTAGKFGFSMMALLAIPILVMMPDILQLWLKSFPERTILFGRLMVIACMFEQLTRGLVHANQAIGNIKWFSIIVSLIRVSSLPISIIALMMGAEDYIAIVIFTICETIGSFSRVFVMHRISGLNIQHFIKSVLLHILPPFIITIFVCIIAYKLTGGLWGMIISTFVSIIAYASTLFLIGFTEREKQIVEDLFLSAMTKISRKNNLTS